MGIFGKTTPTVADYLAKGQKAYHVTLDFDKAFSYFRRGADEFNDSECQYWVGALYYVGHGTQRDYEMAIPWLKKAAREGGYALSNFMLGNIYIAGGCGVEKNDEKAEFWFNKAAAIDVKLYSYVGDIFRLGRCGKIDVTGRPYNSFEPNMIEKDYIKALEWYLKATDKGEKDVCLKIAMIFYDGGFGLEKDYKQALYWFKKSVNEGDISTCALIGSIYCEGGHGVEKDYKMALSWYEKGDSSSHYNAGLIYQYSLDPPDYGSALKWYKKSLEGFGPHENTYFRIGWLYLKGLGVRKDEMEAHQYFFKDKLNGYRAHVYHYGIGVPINYKLAFYHYRIGIENNPSGFVYNGVGLLYQEGAGVSQSHEKAMLYFRKAANLNSTEAFNSIGDVYKYGYGVEVDYKKAFKWYKKAAEGKDDNNGQFNLGVMYLEGKGTKIDYELALRWFKKALLLGNEKAQKYFNQTSILAKMALDNRRLSNQLSEEKIIQEARVREAERVAREEREKVAMLMSQLEKLQSYASKQGNSVDCRKCNEDPLAKVAEEPEENLKSTRVEKNSSSNCRGSGSKSPSGNQYPKQFFHL